jgi:membrane protease YdiL (CAAX protease family)
MLPLAGETMVDQIARMIPADVTRWPRSIPLLWAEFLGLYLIMPVLVAAMLGVINPLLVLPFLMLLALWLLWRTPDFSFRVGFGAFGEWRLVAAFTAVAAGSILLLAFGVVPDHFLEVLRGRAPYWLILMAVYPILSAWPQEVVFRTLFFRRYGRLFPDRRAAIVVNAAAFGLAHLFFGQVLTVALAAVGGGLFAWAYLRNNSTLLAVVLHTIAGEIIFMSGLGIFFYHGAAGG